jgi:NAD-dependent dihydropyrimidine dehydrogenase PreA subunit
MGDQPPKPITEVDGGTELLNRMRNAESIRDWSFILQDYISFGNTKIADNTAIFNLNSATDCPNRETDNCQVPWSDCYAGKAEKQYDHVLPYRRRQTYLWDSLNSETFAKAFLKVVERKRNPVEYLRISEAGDFRHTGDIIRMDRVAEILGEHGIGVYTYSASNYLDWSEAKHFTVNASNDKEEYGDRRYFAFTDEKPDGFIWCPHSKQKAEGVDPDKAIKCGECTHCHTDDGPDIAIPLH